MEHEGFAATLLGDDGMVTGKPALLQRIVPHASADGGATTIYDGRDASGRSLGIFHGLEKQTLGVELGVLCEEGIYAVLDANTTSCLVVWKPLDEP
jgi:hypothetical protein